MDRNRFQQIVQGFAGRRIAVIGDLMTDEYLWGRATRISPESPVMVVEVDRESSVPGGAANVVNNLLALGAGVSVLGVVGADAAGEALRRALADEGAEVSGVVADPSRPTTRKTRVLARSQQVLRVDREQTQPVAEAVAAELLERFSAALREADAVVVSDYAKGVMTPAVSRAVVREARGAGKRLLANAKPVNTPAIAGAFLVQLNRAEAQAAAALGTIGVPGSSFDVEAELETAGASLRRQLDVEHLLVTRGGKGLSIWGRDGGSTHVPAHLVEVYDEAGAGDTIISTTALGLAAGASVEEAARIANRAASIVVRKVGVATVTADELLADWPAGAN